MSSQFNSVLWGGGLAEGQDPATSARSMIFLVFRMLGIMHPGQTPSEDMVNECFSCLNQMLDSWSTERCAVYAITRTPYTLTANQQEYTLGFGGDLDSVRPPRVEAAGLLRSTTETPIDVLSLDQYRHGQSGIHVTGDFPLATLWIQPAPISGDQLVLYTWQPFEMFPDLDTAVSFPFGYVLALRYNLAAMYAPFAWSNQKPKAAVDIDRIERDARMYKAKIKALNLTPAVLRCDSALLNIGGRWR